MHTCLISQRPSVLATDALCPFQDMYVAFMGLQGAWASKLNQILMAIQDCHPPKFFLPQIFLEASPNHREMCKTW